MKPASQEDLAICSAILPLILAWQGLDSAVDVLSLDAEPSGLDGLLAAQGITLRKSMNETHDGWSVITKFDACDALSLDDLEAWASETLHHLKPGGLLVLGGTVPEHAALHRPDAHASPEETAQVIHGAGFARARVISPDLAPDDRSLYSALYGASRKFAVVAQKHAFGKTFDVFSPGFLQISSLSASRRFKHAEEELHGRIHSGEVGLKQRINHLDTTFHTRASAFEGALSQAQTSLRNQAEEIARLHNELEALRVTLKRATRRRGLRKLAYEIKKKLKLKSDVQRPSGTAPPTSAPEKATAVQETQSTDRLSRQNGQTTLAPVEPISLSAREIALRNRLFDEQET
ncbi:hypothetical protein [Marivita sp.]|uniref:hypothetical protein n=1 Tax=Marivita sp. TaxID=2003365 RepID=UPI0025C6C4A4|nr:hypothetical protein [Marivita sp.]